MPLSPTEWMPVIAPLVIVAAAALHVRARARSVAAYLAGGRIATCVGGMDASKERRNLASGTQIVVGTPGRLRDHLERGALDLSALACVVLDEADEMLDMGFAPDIKKVLQLLPKERQNIFFSATGLPLLQLLDTLRVYYCFCRYSGNESVLKRTIKSFNLKFSVIKMIDQRVVYVGEVQCLD